MADFDVDTFLSEGLTVSRLRSLVKASVIQVANKLDVDLTHCTRKQEIVTAIAVHKGLSNPEPAPATRSTDDISVSDTVNATKQIESNDSELKAELAKLELEERKDRIKAAEHEREMERKRLEFEMMRYEEMNTQARMSMQNDHGQSKGNDFAAKLKLVPKFDENDLDSFFLMFERIATKMKWPKDEWAFLIQQVITGKAQSVVSALSDDQSFDYETVKSAIFQSYELIPEAYRQRFRNLRRNSGETHVEFVRRKEVALDRWIRSLKIEKSFESLKEVMLVEECKRSMSQEVRTYVNDHDVSDVKAAAMLADGYELTHRGSRSPQNWRRNPTYQKSSSGGKQNQTPHHDADKAKAVKTSSKTNPSGSSEHESKISCVYCKKEGHLKSQCFKLKAKEKTQTQKQTQPTGLACTAPASMRNPIVHTGSGLEKKSHDNMRVVDPNEIDERYKDFVSCGKVQFSDDDKEVPVVILRDTGATQTLLVANEASLDKRNFTGRSILIQDVNGGYKPVPLYNVELSSQLVSGSVIVGVVAELPMQGISLLLGNDLAGGKVLPSPIVSACPVLDSETEKLEEEIPGIFPSCVVTRAQAMKEKEKANENSDDNEVNLNDTFFKELNENADDPIQVETVFSQPALIKAQAEADDLSRLRDIAVTAEEAQNMSQCFYTKSGVLMRKWTPSGRPKDEDWTAVTQVVVPPRYRKEILRLAHDIPMAGHLGVRKTVARILAHFYWPRLRQDVAEYCRTCHTCQVVGKPQHRIKPAPLIPIPVSQEPFSRVLIDCVGPLPKTKTGFQYLLTIMDTTSRFPEAVPLRNIKARTVIDALLIFFTRYGLPKEIQSDQGSNFMSHVFQEVMYELGIKQINSSAYHPQSQGALERYHQTLKMMIKSYCQENPGEWDKGIPYLLFASRDTPNESTGFTPFELVFGHEPRGPLKVVKEQLLSDIQEEDDNVLDYVSRFRERLSRACELACEHLKSSQGVMKARSDQKAESRSFEQGDRVLVLLPIPGEPLKARFSGPYLIEKSLGKETYVVSTPDRRKTTRVCHVNMLKRYYQRAEEMPVNVVHNDERGANSGDRSTNDSSGVAAVHVQDDVINDLESSPEIDFKSGMIPRLDNSQVMSNPEILLSHLPESERQDVVDIFQEFPQVCSDKLGCAKDIVHKVEVGENEPIKQHPYRLHPDKKTLVNKEVEYMLEHGIIEQSNSSWSSPIVLVPKPDGSQRFCIDFRKVNAVTKTDSFPLPRIEDCIDQVGNAAYVSKIDLMKGYWQVPLSEEAKEISAFVTPQGLFQCRVMPFGMKNAPATFQRMMNGVISGHGNCVVYLDDVLVFSNTWQEHLTHLRDLFGRLSKAGLVVNLAKCEFAKASVTYLGHEIGQGRVAPRSAKVQAIMDFPSPSSKKEVLRFLGMCGFYRKFVPNFSEVVAPLTDLLKKGVKFDWSEACEIAFQKLKAVLMSDPVLEAPNFEKPFQLAVDASDVGIGAVLLQKDNSDILKPVSYYSKKLNIHQRRYSTIEKECLGLVLAVQHFEVYLNNASEVTVYTDHNPLTFLERFRNKNHRLFRWSLILQPYGLKVTHIKGKDNVIADALSRA